MLSLGEEISTSESAQEKRQLGVNLRIIVSRCYSKSMLAVDIIDIQRSD
jgi:hypothetical protein